VWFEPSTFARLTRAASGDVALLVASPRRAVQGATSADSRRWGCNEIPMGFFLWHPDYAPWIVGVTRLELTQTIAPSSIRTQARSCGLVATGWRTTRWTSSRLVTLLVSSWRCPSVKRAGGWGL